MYVGKLEAELVKHCPEAKITSYTDDTCVIKNADTPTKTGSMAPRALHQDYATLNIAVKQNFGDPQEPISSSKSTAGKASKCVFLLSICI